MKKTILIFCMVLLVLPLISSAAVIVNTGEQGIEIQFPPFDVIKQNEDFEFQFHLFNKINGSFIVDNFDCYFHVYNSKGAEFHNATSNETVGGGGLDIQFNVSSGNFSEAGNYGYITQCNSSALGGGFVSVPFKVTPSGREAPSIGESVAYSTTIIIMLLFSIIFFAISLTFKKDENTGDYPSHAAGFKFGFIALSLVIALITLLYVTVTTQEIFWGFEKITSGFTTFHYIILAIFLIAFIFVMVVILFQIMEKMQLKRGLEIKDPVGKGQGQP